MYKLKLFCFRSRDDRREPSHKDTAIRAALTYHNIFAESKENGDPAMTVAAAWKCLDYLLLAYLLDSVTEDPCIDTKLPSHEE